MAWKQMELWETPLTTDSLIFQQLRKIKENQNALRKTFFKRYEQVLQEIDELKTIVREMEKKYKK